MADKSVSKAWRTNSLHSGDSEWAKGRFTEQDRERELASWLVGNERDSGREDATKMRPIEEKQCLREEDSIRETWSLKKIKI